MSKKDLDPNRLVSIWKEDDMLDGPRAKAMVVILRTKGCKWSREQGCIMCGYNVESCQEISDDNLQSQIQEAMGKYDGEPTVKIYTSGSFLDSNEVPANLRREIFESFSSAKRILVESRPEFINEAGLEGIDRDRVEVAIGLETSSDLVRENSVRKGFTLRDFIEAARELERQSIPLRTYLLLKPPFLTEREAVEDAILSIEVAAPYSESISINPVNVQRNTLVEELWRRGDYRPPWLWSLVEVLRRSKELTEKRVFSSPSGGGTIRGAHNCTSCDDKFLKAIERFSFSQDPSEFDHLECECQGIWAALMDVQDEMNTAVDVVRYLSSELEFE